MLMTRSTLLSSSWLVRGADGKEYKPQDYLTTFARVHPGESRSSRGHSILLNRPRDWSTKALTELRQKLAATPQRFTVDHLRKAHELQYHKALVDIISMVKHAANEQEPLLYRRGTSQAGHCEDDHRKTASRRSRFSGSIELKAHLVENLTIEHDDFDALPCVHISQAAGVVRIECLKVNSHR